MSMRRRFHTILAIQIVEANQTGSFMKIVTYIEEQETESTHEGQGNQQLPINRGPANDLAKRSQKGVCVPGPPVEMKVPQTLNGCWGLQISRLIPERSQFSTTFIEDTWK